jgi:serine/threonine protein kinase
MSDDAFAARTRETLLGGVTSGTDTRHALPQIPDHELIRPIGRGSYGDVWLARSVMGTFRAVKIIYRHTFKDAHPFEREYNGIQKFEPISRSHEGLMDILQIGRNDRDGYFYYVMELADGAEMTNDEIQNPKEARNPNDEASPAAQGLRALDFLRHLTFVIWICTTLAPCATT